MTPELDHLEAYGSFSPKDTFWLFMPPPSKLIVFIESQVYLKNRGDEVRSSVGLLPRAASLFVMMNRAVFLSSRGSLVTQ